MANTFVLIGSVTVGSGGASTIDFTSIPNTYTDLCLRVSARINVAAYSDDLMISVNGSTGNLSWVGGYYYGAGSVGSNQSSTSPGNGQISVAAPGTTVTANAFSNSEIYITNYTSSNYKVFSNSTVNGNNAADNILAFETNRWANTSAITQLTLTPRSAGFLQYSTAYLYGIKNS